jgi:probable rRNA maturation factor
MRRVNRGFRGIDRTTDVLSFPGESGEEGAHLGDILVSVPQARRQAAAAGQPVEREIKTLLLHGLLHCLGHDHETDGGEMERLEKRLRRTWVDGAAAAPSGTAAREAGGGEPTTRAGAKRARHG